MSLEVLGCLAVSGLGGILWILYFVLAAFGIIATPVGAIALLLTLAGLGAAAFTALLDWMGR